MTLLSTSRRFESGPLALELGGELPELHVAYESWGELADDGSNAVLVCHGYTSNPHATGWWEGLIGPGKALDTNHRYVVCSNMIGSAYGSTGPASIDPRTGAPYGPDFPDVTLADMVAAQARLLDHIGIGRLAAIVGYSFGGQLALEWATGAPERARCIALVASGVRSRNGPEAVAALASRLAGFPGWNGGRCYGGENERLIRESLVDLRLETLRSYGVARYLADTLGNGTAVDARLDEMARQWANEFDANSLIALRKANARFDATPLVASIEAPVLYVLSRTDTLFTPALAEPTMALLGGAGVEASYFEIDSEYGHFAPSGDWEKWANVLREHIERRDR